MATKFKQNVGYCYWERIDQTQIAVVTWVICRTISANISVAYTFSSWEKLKRKSWDEKVGRMERIVWCLYFLFCVQLTVHYFLSTFVIWQVRWYVNVCGNKRSSFLSCAICKLPYYNSLLLRITPQGKIFLFRMDL